ncbi:hypothetical protein [Porphyrobacter sp. GA68]|uniref:hypothetical protein n=1 Tax=Porphyrobacter sp. GA68 TaxID=2883480 RepID=UPI001D183C61|nr:hypothetical protein [Porphyrobacter sp. GA68]
MIRAVLDRAATGLPDRLAARAATLVHGVAENRARERRHDGARWRQARLLWPSFTKGQR